MTGRDRKNSLKALFGGDMLPQAGEGAAETARAPEVKSLPVANQSGANQPGTAGEGTPARTSSGAVRAMGLSLSSITRDAEEARALRQALQE